MNPLAFLKNLFMGLCLGLLMLFPTQAFAQDAAPAELSADDIGQVLQLLEDEDQRQQLITTLKALNAVRPEPAGPPAESVRTAAMDLVVMLADKASAASSAANALVKVVGTVPQHLADWSAGLEQGEHRQRWLTIAWRLLAVLGAGFLAASFLRLALRPLVRRSQNRDTADYSLLRRLGSLTLLLIYDLLPIVALAVLSYGVLTLVDPMHETRLVAVALINATIFSRLVMVGARFALSPDSASLRLWSLSDETAHYLAVWIKRISVVAIYGFFSLQAGYLLGLEAQVFETLLRLLGLVLLVMLLILIAQNRQDVADAIAPPRKPDDDSAIGAVSSIRRALGRTWHLVTSAYLIVIYAIWAMRIEDGASFLLKATLLTLVILAVGRLMIHAIDRFFDHGLSLSEEMRQRLPGLEQRLNRYFPVFNKLTKLALGVIMVLLIGHAWGIDTLTWTTEGSGRIFVSALLQILLVLGIAFLFWEVASGSIENYLSGTHPDGTPRTPSARTRTLLTVARNALLVVLSVITALMVLSELGINIGPLLAGAGVVGLAVGFGAQRLVQDVITGAFILFQDLMSVGDVVKLGDKAGLVEALSIRTVRLRDLAGVVHTIPFSSIDAVSNLTREFSFHVFEIGIAYREDVDEVIEVIKAVGEELRQDAEIGPLILEPLEVFGLDQFGDSAIVIKGRIKTQPIKQWQVGRAFNRLIKQRFDERDIEIPFPHRTLYFGVDKQGKAPPASLQIENLLQSSAEPES